MPKSSVSRRVAPAVLGVLGVLAVALATHLSWAWTGRETSSPLALWSPWAVIECVLGLSSLLVVLRCVLTRNQRVAWALVALTGALTTAGFVVYDLVVGPGQPIPPFTFADVLWLPDLPLLGYALWRLSRPLVGSVHPTTFLDAVVAGTLAASVMALVLGRTVLSWDGSDPIDTIITLGYPAIDMALVGLLAAIAALAGWRLNRGWVLLSAAISVLGIGNALISRMVATDMPGSERVDPLWAIAGLLIAVAAWQRPHRLTDRPLEMRTMVAPICCAAVAALLVVTICIADWTSVAAVLAVVSVLAALSRITLGIRALFDADEHQRLAITDELTGLYNRRGFLRGVEQALAEGPPRRRIRAVLLLDLDRFKEVNDGLGHQVGDQLLAALAPRLTAAANTDDLLARLGGDEFAVLATVSSAEELDLLTRRLLDAVRQPLPVGGIAVPTDVSIGVAVETDAVAGSVPDRTLELLRCADTAMYRAKTLRLGSVRYDAMGPDRQRDALELAAELRGLLTGEPADGDLELHYQALVATDLAAEPRLEALVRWRHPRHGLIAPDQFIGLAERTGLTPLLTRRVLGMALDQVATWRAGGSTVGVSVNLSASDLLHPTLVDEIMVGLESRGLTSDALTVEITEQVAIGDLDTGHDVLSRLREEGIGVAIDDFGTGYSALSYLQRLPATELKLDRSLTVKLTEDPAAAAIARACIELAHTLSLEVVAEGVETRGQADELVKAGADRLQGWLFGKAELPGRYPPSSVFPLVELESRARVLH